MVCPSKLFRLVVAIVFGTFGIGVAPSSAQEEKETLVPAQFDRNLTDTRGNRWDLNHSGAINDGTNNCFDGGASLRINGGGFSLGRPMMTADKSEYVFSGRSGGVTVTRRVRLDSANGAMRYLEIFENQEEFPQSLVISIVTLLGGSSSQVVDGKNRPVLGQLPEDEVAFMALPQAGRPGVVFLAGDPRGQVKPQVRIQGNRSFEVSYQLEIPPKGSTAILHYIAQRLDAKPADMAKLIKAYSKRGRLTDRKIPEKYAGMLANFVAKTADDSPIDLAVPLLAPFEQLLESAGVDREKYDSVMLDAGAKLAGTVTGEEFTMQTSLGETKVLFADVAGIAGGAGVQKPIRVFLRNGEILTGAAAGAKLSMATDTGLNFDVDLAQIDLLALRRTERDGKPGEGTVSLVTTHSGDRFAVGKNSGAQIEAATPWGMSRIPLAEVDLLTYEREPFPSHRLILMDGSRLMVMLRGGAWSLTTPRFGAVTILPQSVREIRLAQAETRAATEEEDEVEEIVKAGCILIGDNRLAGAIDLAALHLRAEAREMTLDPKQILQMDVENDGGSTDVTMTLKLADGQELRGRISETVLPIRSGQRVWRVPVAHLVSVTVPPPQELSTEAGTNPSDSPATSSVSSPNHANEVRQ